MPKPGRTITSIPAKPTDTAIQRRQPAHSPSIGPASAVITIGAKKKIDIVSASCSVSSARKLNMVEPNRKTPRTTCRGRLRDRGTCAGLFQPRNSTSTSTTWTAKRIHETNGARHARRTRYLALVSRKENRSPAPNDQQDRRHRRRGLVRGWRWLGQRARRRQALAVTAMFRRRLPTTAAHARRNRRLGARSPNPRRRPRPSIVASSS